MKPKNALFSILILTTLAVMGLVDYVLPVDVTSYAFYLIPIGAAAWLLGLRSALLICGLSTGLWVVANPEMINRISSGYVYAWNIFVRLLTFILFASVINRLRTTLLEKDDLIRRLRRALSEAQTDEHIHPVCRECGHIRLNKDHWVTANQFLSRKTDRDFATTYCTECLTEKRSGRKPVT